MPVSQENINRWIDQANIDYIGHYIKAWIPFNAWYNNTFPQLSTDRAKINTIKNEPNTVRNAVNTLLETDSQLSLEFRSHLATLIFHLQEYQIDGREGRISFENIVKERNTINQKQIVFNRNKYFLHRTDGVSVGQVTSMQINVNKHNNGSSIFSYTHTEYDLNHLQNNADYQSLSSQAREQIRICFQELEPTKIISVFQDAPQETPINYYLCDAYKLKRDIQNPNCYGHIVIRALIEILYQMRNVLFHGELVPNAEAQKAYNSAFHLLKIILEKIR